MWVISKAGGAYLPIQLCVKTIQRHYYGSPSYHAHISQGSLQVLQNAERGRRRNFGARRDWELSVIGFRLI
jgi:hypothetical protein